ncbi:MAG TPA: IPT/TIG domain-containing protein [Terriglobia bacterium]|nr:IPT/TIG domain-containing protein [Terriglobia bacterium]
MRIFGPNSGKRQFYLLSALSVLALTITTNFAAGFHGKGWGHSDFQLSIDGIRPASGPASGGTVVTISGTGFTQSAFVAFGGVPAASIAVVSPTQLQAVTPAHAGGTVSIAITENPHNQSAMLPGGFTYTSTSATPSASTSSTDSSSSTSSSDSTSTSSTDSGTSTSIAVSGASPTAGPTSGGTVVTITGSGFQAGASVAFGSSNSSAVTVASSTQINAISPPGSSGTVAISVTNPNGQSASLSSGFTYSSGLSLGNISPSTGPVTGGTTVTITGTGFESGASVSFGGISATSVKLVSSTELQAVSPVSPAGTVTIVVTNSDSQGGTLESAFTYYHTVGLSWTSSSTGASGYNVYRSSTSGGPYARLNSNLVSGTSFSDTKVQAGQTYFYVTTAVNTGSEESSYSNQAEAVVPSP